MKIKFNKELLDTIHAVRDYRRFLYSYHVELLGNYDFDKDAEAEKFFYKLPITGGIPQTKASYEAIICYPQSMLEGLDVVDFNNLGKFEFGI